MRSRGPQRTQLARQAGAPGEGAVKMAKAGEEPRRTVPVPNEQPAVDKGSTARTTRWPLGGQMGSRRDLAALLALAYSERLPAPPPPQGGEWQAPHSGHRRPRLTRQSRCSVLTSAEKVSASSRSPSGMSWMKSRSL